MRSPTRCCSPLPALAALLLGAALPACGNYSTEDIRFYEALPTRADLRVEVPVSADLAAGFAPAAAACSIGSADPWLEARRTSDGINTAVDRLIGLIDAVRRVPPTTRLDDGRIWGPFDDSKHPGVEMQVDITRLTNPDGDLVHVYHFSARRKGVGAVFTPILSGTFVGPSATYGHGTLELDFTAIHDLGMQDADTPRGRMDVTYDRTLDPRTITLVLATQGGFNLVQQFTYDYRGYRDGRGLFRYQFLKPALLGGGLDTLTMSASFAADGAGRGEIGFAAASGATGSFSQCWGADACLTWRYDAQGYSCGGVLPCEGGAESACPAVLPPLPLDPP